LHDLAISHETVQGLAQQPWTGTPPVQAFATAQTPGRETSRSRASWTGLPFRLPFKCPLFWRSCDTAEASVLAGEPQISPRHWRSRQGSRAVDTLPRSGAAPLTACRPLLGPTHGGGRVPARRRRSSRRAGPRIRCIQWDCVQHCGSVASVDACRGATVPTAAAGAAATAAAVAAAAISTSVHRRPAWPGPAGLVWLTLSRGREHTAASRPVWTAACARRVEGRGKRPRQTPISRAGARNVVPSTPARLTATGGISGCVLW